jgi:hypothetical protein
MMKILSGEQEAVSNLTKTEFRSGANGEFRWYFTCRLLRRYYTSMDVKVVVGPPFV